MALTKHKQNTYNSYDWNKLSSDNTYYGMTADRLKAMAANDYGITTNAAYDYWAEKTWQEAMAFEANKPQNTLKNEVEASRQNGINADIVGVTPQSFEAAGSMLPDRQFGSPESIQGIMDNVLTLSMGLFEKGMQMREQDRLYTENMFESMGGLEELRNEVDKPRYNWQNIYADWTEEEKEAAAKAAGFENWKEFQLDGAKKMDDVIGEMINENYTNLPKWKKKQLYKYAQRYRKSQERTQNQLDKRIDLNDAKSILGEQQTDMYNPNSNYWKGNEQAYTEFLSLQAEAQVELAKIVSKLDIQSANNSLTTEQTNGNILNQTKELSIDTAVKNAETDNYKATKNKELNEAVNNLLEKFYPKDDDSATVRYAKSTVLTAILTVLPQISVQSGVNLLANVSMERLHQNYQNARDTRREKHDEKMAVIKNTKGMGNWK